MHVRSKRTLNRNITMVAITLHLKTVLLPCIVISRLKLAHIFPLTQLTQFTCEDDSVDKESNNQIDWYRIDSTEVSYEAGAGKCSAPDGSSLKLQCWTYKYTVGECQVAQNMQMCW